MSPSLSGVRRATRRTQVACANGEIVDTTDDACHLRANSSTRTSTRVRATQPPRVLFTDRRTFALDSAATLTDRTGTTDRSVSTSPGRVGSCLPPAALPAPHAPGPMRRTGTERLPGDARARILASARALFAERGVDASSIGEIAARAQVSKALVLHHFGTKQDVRRAVLDDLLAGWNELLPEVLQAATGTSDRYEAVTRHVERWFEDDPARARVVLRELLDRPAETRELLGTYVRPWLEAVGAYIDEGRRTGRHAPSTDAVAYVFLTLQTILVTVASSQVVDAVLDGDALTRVREERRRIMRLGLFGMQTSRPGTHPQGPPRGASTPEREP